VKDFLNSITVVTSFGIELGIEAAPLECGGIAGYTARMVLYMVTPLVVVMFIICAFLGLSALRGCRIGEGLHAAVPWVLRVLFLAYPVVGRQAFNAFPCHEFADGSSYLRADVQIRCGSQEHSSARLIAWIAIAMYTVGVFVFFACLLFRVRKDKLRDAFPGGEDKKGAAGDKKKETKGNKAPRHKLVDSIAFLHQEYHPEMYW
jgi:hypothetical protein